MTGSVNQIAASRETGRRGYLLDDRAVGMVEEGYADLSYVRDGGRGSGGRRRHIMRLSSGGVFFGKSPQEDQGSLLLIGSRTSRISIGEELTSSKRLEGVELASAVDSWVERLLGALQRGRLPKEFLEPPEDGILSLSPGTAVMTERCLLWASQRTGSSFVFGRRLPFGEIRPGDTFPLTRHAWLLAAEEGEIECISTSTLLGTSLLDVVLDRFMAVWLVLMRQDEKERDRAELRLIAARERADGASMQHACRALGSVLTSADRHDEVSDPLEGALRAAAAHIGITLKTEPYAAQRRVRDRLAAMARASGFSMRRVVLRGAWWEADSGAMVGATSDAEGRSPSALALRWKRKAYWAFDPQTRSEWRITSDNASSVSPFAYVLYRPLRIRRVGLASMLRFALKGTGRDFAALIALGIVAGALAAFTPVLTAVVFDYAIPEADRRQIAQIAVLLLAVALLAGLLQFVRGVAVLRIETRLDWQAQSATWDRLLSLPASFFRKFTAGDLALRASGVSVIRQMVSASFSSFLLTGIFACWYVALLFYYQTSVARWVVGALGLATLVSITLAAFQLKYLRRATEVQTRLSGTVLQLITGISKLRVAGAEIRAYVQWAIRFAEQRRLYVTGRRHANVLQAFQSILPLLLLMLVYGLVARQQDLELSTGEFLAFHAALLALGGTTSLITAAFAAAVSAAPYYEQLRPILEAEPEDDAAKPAPGELDGDIEVRHVTFRYGPDGPPVLDDVSLRVRPGEYLALVGPSGSGKSSLLRLLLGFEQPDAGSIYFDGQDASGLNIQALRRQIGVVLQDGGMLTGDVYTNIVGSSGASMDEAWEAARMAGLEEDLRQMPMGMHTVINEGGTTISGGQRQRLKVARAIVAKPRILLFDEATSALDNVTQAIVTRSLSSLNATRIVIAHRLSTVVHADRILVLDKGRIVQEGSYERLMQQPGLFRDLASRQIV